MTSIDFQTYPQLPKHEWKKCTFIFMKTETTDSTLPEAKAREFEKLLFGAALKIRCGYRLLKMIREREKHNSNIEKTL